MKRAMLMGMLVLVAATPPARAQDARKDRWQLARTDGSYLWDLHLVRLAGDTLVVERADSVIGVPLAGIDELRLVQSFQQRGPGGQRSAVAGLAGADDTVIKLTLYTVDERRRVLAEILRLRNDPALPR